AQAAAGINSADLKPGEFIFEPGLSPDGPVVIIVSIPDQRVHVYRNGVEIGVSTCSTGKPGHTTPSGVFIILQKDKHHHSSTYNNAPMPNMQRLTWRGIALHAGNLPGYPASHGCVRLPREFSERLFGVTHYGTPVIIADRKSAAGTLQNPGLLLPKSADKLARKALAKAGTKKLPRDWSEETVQSVASILVSGADRKVYVMRGGRIEFETGIVIKDPGRPLGTHVYALLGRVPGEDFLRWMAFGLKPDPLGAGGDSVSRLSDETLGRIELVDHEQALQVGSTLQPGTTLVITDFAASPNTRTAPDFVVVTADPEESK
ncbi:MAG: L,D-transpeptidase, partial [Hyphomicrobiales bacterium]